MTTNTMSYFKNLVIMENFFCISRPYLLEDRRIRIICESIVSIIFIIITSIIILDFFTINLSIGCRIFEIIIGIELFVLAYASRYRKAIFDAIKRLDLKCGVDEDNGSKIRAKASKMIFVLIPSIIFDFVGLTLLGINKRFAVFMSVSFSAHDAEMAFASLLIETINMRLEKLKTIPPNVGSRVYRHILIATAHISEGYTPRLLLLLGVTLMTTIAYAFILMITDPEEIIYLSMYLLWRETRAMYSLWLLCSAVNKSGNVCKELSLHLAGRLAQDQSISKEKNPSHYKTLQRWYDILISQQPRYISGSILSVGLSTPILVVDLSINYMLIIVQMYLAYK